jgi:sugar fermentation stimulation protein A
LSVNRFSITFKLMDINNKTGFIKWPKLYRGTLIKRYKRFMADVRLDSLEHQPVASGDTLGSEKNQQSETEEPDLSEYGEVVTAHCPNTGSMLECSEPGRKVYLSRHNNPKRKLKYTWDMIEMPGSLVGTNTMVPNKLVKASIEAGKVPELEDFDSVRSEVKYGQNSRIDLLLEKGDCSCFVEIKNCTLVIDGVALFPDAVTSRGLKHLVELQDQVRMGDRSVMFYLVQRMDATLFRPADHIDPAYGRELRRALKNGVEILAYDVILDLEGIRLNRPVPFEV